MKASFMILPALLMSAAENKSGSGEAGSQKGAESMPGRAKKRGWFDWAWRRRPAPKQTNDAE